MERDVTDEEIAKLVKLKGLSGDQLKCRVIELFGRKVSGADLRMYFRLVALMERMESIQGICNTTEYY